MAAPDFSAFGDPVEAPDFSHFGEPVELLPSRDAEGNQTQVPIATEELNTVRRLRGNAQPYWPKLTGATVSDALNVLNDRPAQQPNLAEDITAGSIKGTSRAAQAALEPKNMALLAAGGVAPLAGRLIAGYFAYEGAKAAPELYQQALEASYIGDREQKIDAYFNLGLDGIFTALTAAHAGQRGLANEVPYLRDALVKRTVSDYSPDQLRGIGERVVQGKATPDEVNLVNEVRQAFTGEAKPDGKFTGARVFQEIPKIKSEALNTWLGVKPTRAVGLAFENQPPAPEAPSISRLGAPVPPEPVAPAPAPAPFAPEPQPIDPNEVQTQTPSVQNEVPAPSALSPQLRQSAAAVAEGQAQAGIAQPSGANQAVTKIVQVPQPERFDTLDDLLRFRAQRLSEERALYQEQIGITPEQSERLQGIFARNGGTERFEESLTPEQRSRFTHFFDESVFNKRDGPFQAWEINSKYNPESIVGENDKEVLANGLVNATQGDVTPAVNSDRFLYATAAARRLQEVGGNQRDIAKAADRYAIATSGSQGDRVFMIRKVAADIAKLLNGQGIDFTPQKLTAPPPPLKPTAALLTDARARLTKAKKQGDKDRYKRQIKELERQLREEQKPAPVTQAATKPAPEVPFDVVEQVKTQGGRISLKSALQYDAGFKPTGILEKLFTKNGGKAIDDVASGINADLGNDRLDGQTLLDALKAVQQGRRVQRERGKQEKTVLAHEQAQAIAFADEAIDGQRAKGSQKTEALPLEQVHVGDQFKVSDEPFKVAEVVQTEDGIQIKFEDGRKFGDQTVLEQVGPLQIDAGSYVSAKPAAEFVPQEQPAPLPKLRSGERGTGDLLQAADQPFNLAGEVEVDQGRLAAEKQAKAEAAAEAKRIQDEQQGIMFSRGQPGEPQPLIAEALQQHFDRMPEQSPFPVEVVQSYSDLPLDLLNEIGVQYGTDTDGIRGVYDNGQIYLIADRLTGIPHAEGVLREEIVHGVIRQAMGSEYDSFIDGVLEYHKGSESYENLKRLYFGGREPQTAQERDTLAQEIVAQVAHDPSINPSLWQRIVAWIRAQLKKWGLTNGVSESEIKVALEKVWKWVRENRGNKGDEGLKFNRIDPETKAQAEDLNRYVSAEEAPLVRGLTIYPNLATIGHLLESFRALPESVRRMMPGVSAREEILRTFQDQYDPNDRRTALEQFSTLFPNQPGNIVTGMGAVLQNMERFRVEDIRVTKALDASIEKIRKQLRAIARLEEQGIRAATAKGLAREMIRTANSQMDERIAGERNAVQQEMLRRTRQLVDRYLNDDLMQRVVNEAAKLSQPQIQALAADIRNPDLTVDQLKAKWKPLQSVSDEVVQQVVGVMRLNQDLYDQLIAVKEASNPQLQDDIRKLDQKVIAEKIDVAKFAREYSALRAKSAAYSKAIGALNRGLSRDITKYMNLAQAHEWMQGAMATPQFQQNYQDAVKVMGARTVVRKTDTGTEITYQNPNAKEGDKPQEITVQMSPMTHVEAVSNFNKLKALSQWFTEYLDSGKDPVLKESYRRELRYVNEVLRAATNDPMEGNRLRPGFLDVFGVLRGIMDVPEAAARQLGGAARSETLRKLKNYSEVRHFASREWKPLAIDIELKAKTAADSHKMRIEDWNYRVANVILQNDMAVGDRHYRQGMSLPGGIMVNASDMAAVRAQKRFFDKLAVKIQEIAKIYPSFKHSPSQVKTIPVSKLGRPLYRDFIPGTELALPRQISPEGRQIAEQWMQAAKGQDRVQALTDIINANHELMLSYFRSFTDPSFIVKSPLRDSIYKVERDIEAGDAPADFSEWITRLQEYEAQKDPPNLMSEVAVRDQVLKDITKSMAAVDSTRSEPSTGAEDPMLDVLDAENFMNNPRGDTIALKGLYDMSLVTRGKQANLVSQVTQVYGQELLNQWRSNLRQLQEKRAELEVKVRASRDRNAVNASSEKAMKEGREMYSLGELDTLINRVSENIKNFRQKSEQGIKSQMLAPRFMRAVKTKILPGLLQGIPVLGNNFFSGVSKLNDMDLVMGMNAKGLPKNLAYAAKNAVNTVLDLLADTALGQEKNSRVAKTLDTIRRNPGPWQALTQRIYHEMERRQERLALMSELGLTNYDPFLLQLKARAKLAREGGELRGNTPTKLSRKFDQAANLWEGFWEAALFGGRGVHLADAAINMSAYDKTAEFVGDLQLRILKAFRTRVSAGEDPDSIRLSPEEMFGNRLMGEKQLQHLRFWFEENGLDLDVLARDYYKAVEAAPQAEKGSVAMLDKYGVNSLAQTIANQVNRAAYGNRPVLNTELKRTLALFMGYEANQNAQASLLWSKAAKGAGKVPELKNAANFFIPSLLLKIALGTLVAAPIIDKLVEFWEKKKRTRKTLSDVESAKDLIEVVGYATGPYLPIVGQAVNTMLQPGNPGRGFLGSNFQLLPMSILDATKNTMKQMVDTGEIIRPLVQYETQWNRNANAIVNRLDFMEGSAAFASTIAAQRNHTPASIETRKPSGTTPDRYSKAWGQIQDVKNELGKQTLDRDKITQYRSEGIEKLRAAGSPTPEQTFDRSLLASANKYLTVYGRELTPEEKARIDAKKSPEEKAESDRIDANVQQYAQMFGAAVPDFVKTSETGTRGGTRESTGSAQNFALSARDLGTGGVGRIAGGEVGAESTRGTGTGTGGTGAPRATGLRRPRLGGRRISSGIRRIRVARLRGRARSRVRPVRIKRLRVR